MKTSTNKAWRGIAPLVVLKDQGGGCAICRRPLTSGHRDHCHDTDKPRGILCGPCNAGLGMFQDDEAVLLSAVEYLRKHRGTKVKLTRDCSSCWKTAPAEEFVGEQCALCHLETRAR